MALWAFYPVKWLCQENPTAIKDGQDRAHPHRAITPTLANNNILCPKQLMLRLTICSLAPMHIWDQTLQKMLLTKKSKLIHHRINKVCLFSCKETNKPVDF